MPESDPELSASLFAQSKFAKQESNRLSGAADRKDDRLATELFAQSKFSRDKEPEGSLGEQLFAQSKFAKSAPQATPEEKPARLSEAWNPLDDGAFQPGYTFDKKQADARKDLLDTIKQVGMSPSLTSAANTALNKDLRFEDGKILTPQLGIAAPKGAGVIESVGMAAANLGKSLAGMLGKQSDELSPALERIQKQYGLSDTELNAVWGDLIRMNASWEKDENTRVLSDGTLMLNPQSKDILDPEKTAEIINNAKTSPEARQRLLSQYQSIRKNAAANRLEAYETAAEASKMVGATPGYAKARDALGLVEGTSGRVPSPSEWAKSIGETGPLSSPEFIARYEKEVLDKEGKAGAYVRSIALDGLLGWNKVATTALGVLGLAGFESAAELAAEGQEFATNVVQGKTDTGMVGAVVQEAPSILTQVVASQLTGGLSMAATGSARVAQAAGSVSAVFSAGAQSAGMAYADNRFQGMSHEEAQASAIKQGANTALITGIFQTIPGFGGVETVTAGKAASEVTLRDVLAATTKQELWQSTRGYAKQILTATVGEASEEGIDQITSAFLTADPDTNLSTAWSDAVKSAKVGGFIGSATNVVAGAGQTESMRAADRLLTPETAQAAPAAAEAARNVAPAEIGTPEPEISPTTTTNEQPEETRTPLPVQGMPEAQGQAEVAPQAVAGQVAPTATAQQISPQEPTDSLPAGQAAAPEMGAAAAPTVAPADQPAPGVQPRAMESAPPRPPRMGRDTAARDAWDETYGSERKGGRTHNDDGTPYQPTVHDETAKQVVATLNNKSYDEKIDAIGVDTGIELGTALRQLLNDGWVWDAKQERMVDPQGRGETPIQAIIRIRKTPTPQTNAATTPVETGTAATEQVARDEEVASEPLSAIYNRTEPGPEREAAVKALMEAAKRIALSLRRGDVIYDEENGEMTVDSVTPKGYIFVKGVGAPVDGSIFFSSGQGSDAQGNRIDIPPGKILRRAETPTPQTNAATTPDTQQERADTGAAPEAAVQGAAETEAVGGEVTPPGFDRRDVSFPPFTELNDYQREAYRTGKPAHKATQKGFIETPDGYFVDPAQLPPGAVVDPEDLQGYAYPKADGTVGYMFMDLDGVAREGAAPPELAAKVRPTPTTQPGLSLTELKSTFDLTDEQADAAQSMSRAFGLTPEQVILQRELGRKVTQKEAELVVKKRKEKKVEVAAAEKPKGEPLGLDRTPVVDDRLRDMTEDEFLAYRKKVRKDLEAVESRLDDDADFTLIDQPDFRAELAPLQDTFSAVENEFYRRTLEDMHPEQAAAELTQLNPRSTAGKVKAAILVSEIQRQGLSEQMRPYLDSYANRSPDHAEVLSGIMQDVKDVVSAVATPKGPTAGNIEAPKPTAEKFQAPTAPSYSETPNWDNLTPEQKYDDLVQFTKDQLTQFGASENTQGMGAPALRLGTGARGVTIQLGERGQSRLSDLLELRRTGRAPQTAAGIEGSSGVRVTLGQDIVLEALESGDQAAAKRYLARAVSEEIIHAAHFIAVKESLGEGATSNDVVAELQRVFDVVRQQAPKAEFEKAVTASMQAYRGVQDPFRGGAFDDGIKGAFMQAGILMEMVRQHVQTRKNGATTEEARPSWVGIVQGWLGRTLDILRGFAQNPEALGERYAQEIARVESVLAELEGRPTERLQNRPQGAKGSAQLTPEGKVLLKGFQSPDFTTAAHEMMHGFEMTGYGDLTDAEVSQLKAWAGSKTEGRSMMETPASEKLARGWERYLAEGKAPLARLQALFDKMAKWMLGVYKQIEGSDIDVDISPEVRAIFDKVAARMDNPSVVETPHGATIETADGSALPPVVPEVSENSTPNELAGYLRGLAEKDAEQPDLTGPEWNPENLYSLQKRRSYEEADEYKLDTTAWVQAEQAFPELWEIAINRPPGYGAALLNKLIMEGNTNPTSAQIAQLTHEGLRLRVEIDRANQRVAEALAAGDEKLAVANLEALQAAIANYQTLQNYAAAARTEAGRALNAWKYALRDDFSYATLETQHLRNRKSLGVTEVMTDADRRSILAYAEKQAARQAELIALREASESERAGLEERLARAEALIATLMDEAKAAKKKQSVSNVAKKLVVDRVRKAAAEARARLKSANAMKPDTTERFQAPSAETDPLWYDRVTVLAEVLIADPAMAAARFADRVRQFFGDAYFAVAEALRKDADRQLKKAYSDLAGTNVVSPEDIMAEVGEDTEITRELIYELARAHVFEGAKGFEVLNNVTRDLRDVFPDVTRDQVAQIFTKYGEQTKLSPAEEARILRDAKALELVQKQIEDLERRGEMKKTGRAKDEPSQELRDLRKKRDDLAKSLGYTPKDPATQMSSAQSAAKKRMQNEIEELQAAIESGVPRVRVRRGIEYTAEMDELRAALEERRKAYEEVFGTERTVEEVNARLIKDLDRRIAKEEDLINRGLLREPEALRPLVAESADVLARRERLKELRQQKRDAYEAAHPGETALKQAMDAAQKAVERRQAALDAGVPAVTGRAKRGAGVTPTTELQDLWDAADRMDDLIREIRRARPETPARQQARLDAAYDAAVRTREDLLRRISEGDLATNPATPRPVDARLRAIREENAALRKQLTQMRKDAGWGPFSQQAREVRREAALENRLAEIQRRRREQDFSKKPRKEPVTSQRIRELEAAISIAQVKYMEAEAKRLFADLPYGKKFAEKAMALWMARQVLNLTGDFGIFGRQLGKVKYKVVVKDLVAIAKKLKNREKVDLKKDSLTMRVLSKGLEVFKDPKVGDRSYFDITTDPRYLFRKKNGFRAVKPHETSHELTSEGRVRINPMEVLNNKVLALIMITKGTLKTAIALKAAAFSPLSAMAAWPIIRDGIGQALGGTVIAIAGVRFARRVEAAQTAMVNEARWGLMDYIDIAAQSIDPSKREQFYKDTTEADMILSGKLAGKGTKWLADNAYAVGLGLAFPQYNITNLQSALMVPVLGSKTWAGKKYAAGTVGFWLAGAAAQRIVLSAILGAITGDDEDKDKNGVVLNHIHPRFGQLKIGNTYINPDGGALKWYYQLAKVFNPKTMLDPEMLRLGEEIEMEKSAFERKRQFQKFMLNQLNMNVKNLAEYFYFQQAGDDTDLARVTWYDQTDILLDEVAMNLALQQSFEIFEKHGMADAFALWTLMMTGTDVNVQMTDEEYDAEIDKRDARYDRYETANPEL